MLWVKLAVALLGYVIAAVIALLDYKRRFKDGRTIQNRLARRTLFTLLIAGLVLTPIIVWREEQQARDASVQLTRMEGMLKSVAARLGVKPLFDEIDQAIRKLQEDIERERERVRREAAESGVTEKELRQAAQYLSPGLLGQRVLLLDQFDTLIRELRSAPAKIEISTIDGDSEATDYGAQLQRVFVASGWKVEKGTFVQVPRAVGIEVQTTSIDPTKRHPVWTVVKALSAAGLPVVVRVAGNPDPVQVKLMIGSKP